MGEKNRFFYVGMGLGFVLAFAVLWFAMPHLQKITGQQVPALAPVAPADRVDEAGLRKFLHAAEAGDFAIMRTTGEEIFARGRVIPNSTVLLASYEVNSHPPYLVYAFMTENTETATRRVLLTLDDKDRVESFLAEEMAVIP